MDNIRVRPGSKTAFVGLYMQWDRILIAEFAFLAFVLFSLGFIKAPRWMMRRKLARGSPWGYYPDQVPKKDPGYYDENDHDFLHDMGTQFGGLEGFGEYGEFSGFGELGEFGGSFFGGSDS
ncbi:MAG: hypothetical protein P4L53_00215 [Candidatus Obscuribacterales bacterium]|nr:hypothetical protein [Candidatus Obscuribacterales bacterium]